VADDLTFQGETAVLHRLLAELLSSRKSELAVADLEARQQFAMGATYFLLDVGEQVSIERFATFTLGRILQQLTRETEQRYVTYSGQVRGRLNWSQTIKARYSQDYDPTRYVCREVKRRYDTLENQLLKQVVEDIYACLLAVPPVMRQGACYYPLRQIGRYRPVATAIRLGRIETALNQARYNVRFREITPPDVISPDHLRAAEMSRQEEYAEVALLYRHYQALITSPTRWQAVAHAGRRALPLPARTDAEGALWLQLGAAILKGELSKGGQDA
jgi:hypothetical protein